MSSKVISVSVASSLIIGLALFFGLQVREDARIAEDLRVRNESIALACEVFLERSLSNFEEDMPMEGYEDNFKFMSLLPALGGDPEYLSLLNKIVTEYEKVFDGDSDTKGEPFVAMLALEGWCSKY